MADVAYALADGGVSVAYRVLEAEAGVDAPRDVVLVTGGVFPIEILEDDPGFARLLEGLRGLGRVIVLDRRGIGLSDPILDWERPVLDQWADDVAAVVAAAGAEDVVLVSVEGFGVGSRFVAEHPDVVGQFVLYGPNVTRDEQWEEYRLGRLDSIQANIRGERDALEQMAPSRARDPEFRAWYERAGRLGASPATAGRLWASVLSSPPSGQRLDEVSAPTLVMQRRHHDNAPPGALDLAAKLVQDATVVELDGSDVFAFAGDVDALVAEIAHFVTGERRVPRPERELAAVYFSDLVRSTERAAALGDARWKVLLDRHDAEVRAAVGACGGKVVKTTGDGVLALFPSASGALKAARRCRSCLADVDLRVRVGIHVGEVDRRGDDVSGLAVNIAARVMSLAPDDGVAVTDPVVMTMVGQPAAFEPMGPHALKGVPGMWELHRLVD